MGCCFITSQNTPKSSKNFPDSYLSSHYFQTRSLLTPTGGSFLNYKPGVNLSPFSVEYDLLNEPTKALIFDVKNAVHKHTGILVSVIIISKEFLKSLCFSKTLETIQALDHPNISRVFEKYMLNGEEDVFLVREEISGINMWDYMVDFGKNMGLALKNYNEFPDLEIKYEKTEGFLEFEENIEKNDNETKEDANGNFHENILKKKTSNEFFKAQTENVTIVNNLDEKAVKFEKTPESDEKTLTFSKFNPEKPEFINSLAKTMKLSKSDVLDECVLLPILSQILSALQYLHSKGMIYNSICLESIIVEPECLRVKLEDFLTITLKNQNDKVFGNIYYMAPELFYQEKLQQSLLNTYTQSKFHIQSEIKPNEPTDQSHQLHPKAQSQIPIQIQAIHPKAQSQIPIQIQNQTKISSKSQPEIFTKPNYNQEVDLWALGVLIFVLVTGKYPFGGTDGNKFNQVIEEILYKEILFEQELYCSESLVDLIKNLLEKNPKKRLTASKALKHRWFQERNEKSSVYFNFERNSLLKLQMESQSQRLKILFLSNIILTNEEKNEILIFYANFLRKKWLEGLKISLLSNENYENLKHVMKNEQNSLFFNFYDFINYIFEIQLLSIEKIEAAFKNLDIYHKENVTLQLIVERTKGKTHDLKTWKYLLEEKLKMRIPIQFDFKEFHYLYTKLIDLKF